MAPQPKRKHALHRDRVRALAKRLTKSQLVACPSCKKLIMSHRVCPFCGYYDGKVVVAQKEVKSTNEETR